MMKRKCVLLQEVCGEDRFKSHDKLFLLNKQVKRMSSNPVIEAIKSRRTVRNFLDKPVSQEVIDTILGRQLQLTFSLGSSQL
jgi:hypothetical protein